MLENVLLAQQKQDEYIKQLASKVDLLTTHNKMLESQIPQQANSSTTSPSRLPRKPKPNPRDQCNVQLEGPRCATVGVESQKEHDKGVTSLPSENEPQDQRESERPKELKTLSVKPYMSPFPFPQRFAKTKLESQFGKFLDMLKKLHVNIPFIDTLSQRPLYMKFLKEILSKKKEKLMSMRR